jgi:hypothetical protein
MRDSIAHSTLAATPAFHRSFRPTGCPTESDEASIWVLTERVQLQIMRPTKLRASGIIPKFFAFLQGGSNSVYALEEPNRESRSPLLWRQNIARQTSPRNARIVTALTWRFQFAGFLRSPIASSHPIDNEEQIWSLYSDRKTAMKFVCAWQYSGRFV